MKKQVLGLGLLLIGQVTFANTFVDMKTNRPIRPPEWMAKILVEKLGK